MNTFNLDVNFFKNPKIKYILSMDKGDKYALFWLQLLVIAKESSKNGKLYNKSLKHIYDEKLLSIDTGYDIEFINKALTLFESLFMIERKLDGITIKNWSKYQKVSNVSTESTAVNVIDYNDIIKLYNDICTCLPSVKLINNKRTKLIKKATNIFHSLEEFKNYFITVNTNSYLIGKNKYGWKANFDWCMSEENIAKVLEGRYLSASMPSSNENTKNFLKNIYLEVE